MHLDALPLLQNQVGYGGLGLHGSLGYEEKSVSVQGISYPHALSTHPPAHLLFQLGGRFSRFHCQVALNDDVQTETSHADFTVWVDGHVVASASGVVAGEAPRTLSADITGAELLELVVETGRWEHCHAVWLDPLVDEVPGHALPDSLLDCLGRTEITPPPQPLRAERCIATIVSPGFETMLDDMLGSLCANGNCQDTLLVVFTVGESEACAQVIAKYQATVIPCQPRVPVNLMVKAVLYSVARVVDARQFLCLDADMLVLGDLQPVFAALDACPEGSVLACREGNGHGFEHLGHALCSIYGGRVDDLPRLLRTPDGEGSYPLIVNDGLFAGSRSALLALDGVIRAMPQAIEWVDERADIWWRNQFVFNLALAQLQCGVELDASYNIQLHVQDVEFCRAGGQVQARWSGQLVRVVHFSGEGKQKYPEWQGLFAQVPDPLAGSGGGDFYTRFLTALRGWVGRHGLAGLAWSFYGTTDASSARVRDPSTLPLLALLHYLIRANGCMRVLETGTARGISTACLASAVAHRTQGHIVTFDVTAYAEREDLWAALPETIRACIEPRAQDSLEGMTAALEAGERYDAALLDTIHTGEQVWAEFQLATQLVCPGGLILIHDVRYAYGTVEQGLRRIEAAGYGVTRLWTAESEVCEDDQLGLALIENRRPK